MQPATYNLQLLRIWLLLCIALVMLMVLIGGYTRLSGSGLSIISWKPIHGSIPPLNDIQWQEEFTAYQTSPQYQKINTGMTLNEFRAIFWPEFIHRLLGRIIGIVFLLPLAYFAFRRRILPRLAWRLFGIFLLGGAQGLVGWLMVKSGLIDTPQVSPIRLAAHLSLAFTILGLLLWTYLDFFHPRAVVDPLLLAVARTKTIPSAASPPKPWRRSNAHLLNSRLRRNDRVLCLWFTLLCLQIILGAFMAGTHAGLIYNTWPTMNGQWIPDGLAAEPWYANVALIQFFHRGVAILVAITYFTLWIPTPKTQLNTLLAALLASQFALGVITLLYQAPLALALMHQMLALLLFCVAVTVLHSSCKSFAIPQNSLLNA